MWQDLSPYGQWIEIQASIQWETHSFICICSLFTSKASLIFLSLLNWAIFFWITIGSDMHYTTERKKLHSKWALFSTVIWSEYMWIGLYLNTFLRFGVNYFAPLRPLCGSLRHSKARKHQHPSLSQPSVTLFLRPSLSLLLVLHECYVDENLFQISKKEICPKAECEPPKL